MAWCRQATSHCLSQCWPRSLSPHGVARPHWINAILLTMQHVYICIYIYIYIYSDDQWSHFRQFVSYTPSHDIYELLHFFPSFVLTSYQNLFVEVLSYLFIYPKGTNIIFLLNVNDAITSFHPLTWQGERFYWCMFGPAKVWFICWFKHFVTILSQRQRNPIPAMPLKRINKIYSWWPKTVCNRVCHSDGYYWDDYPGTVSLIKATVNHLKIGYL